MPIAHTKRHVVLALALTALVGAAVTGAATAAGTASSSTATVQIKDIDFKPKRVTIRRGGSVRWLFQDARTPHNVHSVGRPRFRSSQTKQEGSHRVTFKRSGRFRYVCTIHLNMKGTVVVR